MIKIKYKYWIIAIFPLLILIMCSKHVKIVSEEDILDKFVSLKIYIDRNEKLDKYYCIDYYEDIPTDLDLSKYVVKSSIRKYDYENEIYINHLFAELSEIGNNIYKDFLKKIYDEENDIFIVYVFYNNYCISKLWNSIDMGAYKTRKVYDLVINSVLKEGEENYFK